MEKRKNIWILASVGSALVVLPPFVTIGISDPLVFAFPVLVFVFTVLALLARRMIQRPLLRDLIATIFGFGILWGGIRSVVIVTVGWIMIFESLTQHDERTAYETQAEPGSVGNGYSAALHTHT